MKNKPEKPPEGGAPPEPTAPAPQVVTPTQAKSMAERAEAGEKLPVGELALVTGNLRRVNLPTITTVNRDRSSSDFGRSESDGQTSAYTAEHQAAATLHGWPLHAHHTAAPMQLTLTEYRKALEAANTTPDGYLTPVPHAPAFSPHAVPVTLVTSALKREPFKPAKASP
jgi:hypothetical protein